MRFRNLEQDLSGIFDWRLPGDHSLDGKEVYTAVDAPGKRLRLSIGMESFDGAISSIEFRRFEQCPCKGNVDGHAVGHCNTRRGGGFGFANDNW
ncbi:hypothetical protein AAVH_26673 [Aphelenchoides avenae]|nr:hypothetical protein AAVH_26673 [Aphelenchus avenae]